VLTTCVAQAMSEQGQVAFQTQMEQLAVQIQSVSATVVKTLHSRVNLSLKPAVSQLAHRPESNTQP
jgi:outer membrane lipoprotein-sorting protein